MLLPIPPKFRSRRRRPRPAPPAALALVTALYDHDGATLAHLYFDRDIDIATMDPAQIIVDDPAELGRRFRGMGEPAMPGANSVQVELEDIGPATGSVITLSAGPNSGIVAVDDGGTWPGVSDLPLPFP